MRQSYYEIRTYSRNFVHEQGIDADVSNTRCRRALPPAARDGFLQLVAGKLSAYPPEARGPGLVHRLATEAQRDFLKVAVGVGGKYSRPPYLWGERR
jgi:hypothetical protein